ncbi:hypothetical protein IPF37_02810 [bacterium]|nr:MAG: hypothetical protein IPF37_02810 [bacterium]
MKKTLILAGCLLFSSVHAQMYSEAAVTQAAAELLQNTELVVHCRALYEHGLTPEQIVAIVLKHDIVKAYSDGHGNVQMNEYPMPLILGIVGAIIIGAVIEFFCSDSLFSKSTKEQDSCNDN